MKRPDNLDVWVLAGQSNMQGCGWLEGALAPDQRVWSFTSSGAWEIAFEPLHRHWESFTPVDQNFMRSGMSEADRNVSDAEWARRENESRVAGAGLGIAFGKAMADALGRPIGLLPAAHGGTSLDQWSPVLKGVGGVSMYGGMLERIARAGGRLRGILWYQGESDTNTIETGRTYAERLGRWIAAVRADTGISDLPVVVVQIGRVAEPPDRAGTLPAWDLVREALSSLPDRIPRTAATTAVDLPLVDIVHVDTAGLIRLGKRMARLALKLTDKPDLPGGPRVERIERTRLPDGSRNGLRVNIRGAAGRLAPASNIQGFTVRPPAGEIVAPLFVVNAWVDSSGGTDEVIVLLNREPEEAARLGYGIGINPVCNLVDEADMALPAFLFRALDR
jgi:sialate O-acetylesterase